MTPLEVALAAAKQALSDRAKAYTASPAQNWAFLCEAAETFAKAKWALKAPPPRPGSGGLVIPFGKNKGQALSEATEKDLQYVAGAMRESIADPAKARWAGKNQELLDGIEAELRTR